MKKFICLCLSTLIIILLLPGSAYAMPTQGQYSSENAKYATISSENSKLNIRSNNDEDAVIEWESFDVYNNADISDIVFFGGENINYLIIIHSSAPTVINGSISGKANIYMINPNGVIFGVNSKIDVNNLYVSTRAIDQDVINSFKNDTLYNEDAQPKGDIIVLGKINAESIYLDGNSVYLDDSDISINSSDKLKVASDDYTLVQNSASILSEGCEWIFAGVAAAAAIGVAAIVILKKKKTGSSLESVEESDETEQE